MLRTCPSCNAANRVPAARMHETAKCGRCKTVLAASSAPIEIQNRTTFDDVIEHATVPVLVDFWAEWCGPCRMVAPEVASAATQLAGHALVLKVNTEKLPELASRYRVQGIPNFVVFDRGAVVRQQAGAMRAADLVRLVPGAQAA